MTRITLPSDRFDYSPLPDRGKWSLPGGAQIAIYTVVSVEEWDIQKPIVRQYVPAPQGIVPVPDVQNWSWHEFGMRVGFWRILDALTARGIRASAAVNARLCKTYPPIAQAILDANWEFVGHGVVQGPLTTAPDQRAVIRETRNLLKAFTGKTPKGWLGPGLTETWDTLDILAEEGYSYVADWSMDEQPVTMRTSAGPLVAMPFSLETGDLPMMVAHHHASDVWLQRMKDQFDRLYMDGAHSARVMPVSVHPYITGVPHRIKYFEQAYDYFAGHKGVWFATAEEIYDWFVSQAVAQPAGRPA